MKWDKVGTMSVGTILVESLSLEDKSGDGRLGGMIGSGTVLSGPWLGSCEDKMGNVEELVILFMKLDREEFEALPVFKVDCER